MAFRMTRDRIACLSLAILLAAPPAGADEPQVWTAHPTVPALLETPPVGVEGDAADDPAIIVDPGLPTASLVVGTQKQGGLLLYDLGGTLLQSLPAGRFNNVDARAGFAFPGLGGAYVLIGASNRSDQSVTLYRLDPRARRIDAVEVGRIATGLEEVYGFCLYRDPDAGHVFAIATDKEGPLRQWRLRGDGTGAVTGDLVRVVPFGSITEGCVADDARGTLFVGEENVGIWRLSAKPDVLDGEPYGIEEKTLVAPIGPTHGLVADVEGLTIVETGPEEGYLIASSQGDSSFAVFSRDGARHLGSFRITASTGADGVTGTDGIAATGTALGPRFPFGLLVVQDDENTDPAATQNFKYVSLADVLAALPK